MFSHYIRRLWWVVPVTYLISGVFLFFIARMLECSFSALRPPLLFPTRVFLWVGPPRWLALMVSVSGLLIATRIRFRSRHLKTGVIVALCVALSGVVVAGLCLITILSYQPGCVFTSNIATH